MDSKVCEVNSTSHVCSDIDNTCKVLLTAFDPSESYNVTITTVSAVGESEGVTYTDITGKMFSIPYSARLFVYKRSIELPQIYYMFHYASLRVYMQSLLFCYNSRMDVV